MYKSMAKRISDIASYKDQIIDLCEFKCIDKQDLEKEKVWIFSDTSTISINVYGGCKVDGKYITLGG